MRAKSSQNAAAPKRVNLLWVAALEAIGKHEETGAERKDIAKALGWSDERLASFMELALAYWRNGSIKAYVQIRREFPDAQIEGVARFVTVEVAEAFLDTLFVTAATHGVDPGLLGEVLITSEGAAIDAPIDALSLHLLELLIEGSSKRPRGVSGLGGLDATVSFLISVMLEVLEAYGEVPPPSLVVLTRHHLCGATPDLHEERLAHEKPLTLAYFVARKLQPDKTPSVSELAKIANISRSAAARLLRNPKFRELLGRFAREPTANPFGPGGMRLVDPKLRAQRGQSADHP